MEQKSKDIVISLQNLDTKVYAQVVFLRLTINIMNNK